MTPELPPVALVTGASGALGAAVVRLLAADGFAIGLHAHTGTEVTRALATELGEAHGLDTSTVAADVRDPAAVEAAVADVETALGPIGVLVTCAGTSTPGHVLRLDPHVFADSVAVNLLGTYHACRAVVGGMLKRRVGRIVTVTSPAGVRGRAGHSAYAAAKAGVVGLTLSLAKECGARGVTVNAISPGMMDTAMTSDVPESVRADIRDRTMLGRFGTPDEVARGVRFLVHDGFVTGTVLEVDGGLRP